MLAVGIFFFINKRPVAPDWFKYDATKPYEVFNAWKHLSTRKATVVVGPNWTVMGGILTDEWGRPLANTPLHYEMSSRHSQSADLVTDAHGYFLAYGPSHLEIKPPYQPPGRWDSLVAKLPQKIRTFFTSKPAPWVTVNMDSSSVSASPGYPNSAVGRAYAKSQNDLQICLPKVLLSGSNRVFYQFIVKRKNSFTPSGLAAFQINSFTDDSFIHSRLWGTSPVRKREGSTEGRVCNRYQICILNPASQPVAQAHVKFMSYDGSVDNQQVVETDHDGKAELEEWLLTGDALKQRGTNYFHDLQRTLEIDADSLPVGPIAFALSTNGVNLIKLKPAATIAGNVVSETDYTAGAGFQIYYPGNWFAYAGEVYLRRDGSFRYEQIMPDEPLRLLGRFGYGSTPVEINLPALKPGESLTNLTIQTIQPAALFGTITDKNGQPVKAWDIRLTVDGKDKLIAEGERFGFPGIGSKPFRISIKAKDHLEYLSDVMQLEPGEVRFLKFVVQINPGKLAVKPLREWLEDLNKYGGEQQVWAQDAIKKIGTNALPELFTLLQSTNGIEWNLALRGFETLGPIAHPIVPELLRILQDEKNTQRTREVAIHALVGIKAEEATPVLIQLIEADENHRVKDTAIWALGRIRKQPEIAVPLIMKVLTENREEYRVSCLYALGDFGPDARAALPLVLKALDDKDSFKRSYASNALKQIDREFAEEHGVK